MFQFKIQEYQIKVVIGFYSLKIYTLKIYCTLKQIPRIDVPRVEIEIT